MVYPLLGYIPCQGISIIIAYPLLGYIPCQGISLVMVYPLLWFIPYQGISLVRVYPLLGHILYYITIFILVTWHEYTPLYYSSHLTFFLCNNTSSVNCTNSPLCPLLDANVQTKSYETSQSKNVFRFYVHKIYYVSHAEYL